MEQGKYEATEEGSAQGSVMSPMLANIYMHHVLTLWFKFVIQKEMKGDCFLVNFADDFVAGFQYKSEAERYYKQLKERMEKFGLKLESSKSRLIEFGRFAEKNRRERGERKPETFDFLGFTFYCSKTRKGGSTFTAAPPIISAVVTLECTSFMASRANCSSSSIS